jgi:hypothetical protein
MRAKRFLRFLGSSAAALAASGALAGAQTHKPPKPPKSVRLYIFDCGVIHTTNGDAYSLKKEEMASTEMSIPCILVAHPKGTLMWDNGRRRDAGHAAAAADGGRRLRAGRYHLSLDVALSRRSRRERELIRGLDVAGAEGGT